MPSKPGPETLTGADAPRDVVEPGETDASDAAEQIEGIPLYLIWTVIKDQIQKKREAVARIEVQQRAGHFYTITVMTSEPRVLRRKRTKEKAAKTGGETGE
jgi:hypothetical protein